MKEKSKLGIQNSEVRSLPSNASIGGRKSEGIIENLVKMLKHRVDAWEIFYSSQNGIAIEAKGGAVDAFKVSSSHGIGLRVLRGSRAGFAFTSMLSGGSIDELIDNAIMGSEGVEPDEFISLPSLASRGTEQELMIFDPLLAQMPEEEKINKAVSLEQSAKGFDPRITKVRKASYHESFVTTRIVNFKGVDAGDMATFVSSSIMAVAEDKGDSQMGWEMGMGHFATDVDVVKVGRDAAKRAVDMLDARTIKTIKCPVVIENVIVCEFLEVLAPSFLSDNIVKGKSMLKGKKGEKVFSPNLTIWDNGLLPNGWSTSRVDGEGVPRHKTCLVDKGVCAAYLYDTYWAKREGAVSTGSAARSNFKSVATVGISNLYMEKGEKDLEGLLASMDKGLFITNILGANTANPITGDFSFGATGLWVEGGKISYPVRGAAITGNILRLFSNVEFAGRDLRFIGRVGAPSLLISEMEISGVN